MNHAVPAISLEGVSKKYGSKTVVHDLTFSVNPGEIVGFLGPNGAGKTTTMRMVAGVTLASSGVVTVAGFNVATEHEAGAARLGYLPEHPPIYDTLDVTQYLRFVAHVKGIPRREMASEIDRVATICGITQVLNWGSHKLSKGYRQRVALAQALLGKPEVLLLDEPTAGLDPEQSHATREIIRTFGQTHAVLFSTHILSEVTLICQRVAIINQGCLLAIDSPMELERASQDASRITLVATAPAGPLQKELLEIAGITHVIVRPMPVRPSTHLVECLVEGYPADVEGRIARTVAQRWELHHLERQRPTLENVFLRYVATGRSEREA